MIKQIYHDFFRHYDLFYQTLTFMLDLFRSNLTCLTYPFHWIFLPYLQPYYQCSSCPRMNFTTALGKYKAQCMFSAVISRCRGTYQGLLVCPKLSARVWSQFVAELRCSDGSLWFPAFKGKQKKWNWYGNLNKSFSLWCLVVAVGNNKLDRFLVTKTKRSKSHFALSKQNFNIGPF